MPRAVPMLADSGLIQVVPGLMIWTLIAFGITFFVLRRFAFGPIQQAIDMRRDRIREALDEADRARAEAEQFVVEQREALAKARTDAEAMLAETRSVADASTGACAKSSMPSGSGASRRRGRRSRRRPRVPSRRSAPRSPTSRWRRPRR